MKEIYLIKKGNNGATYIFNTKDINSILYSLKYYKAVTFRQYLVKNFLFSNLIITKYFTKAKLIDLSTVRKYLKENTLENISRLFLKFAGINLQVKKLLKNSVKLEDVHLLVLF